MIYYFDFYTIEKYNDHMGKKSQSGLEKNILNEKDKPYNSKPELVNTYYDHFI